MLEEVIIDFQLKGEEQLDPLIDKLDQLGLPPNIVQQFKDLFKTIKSGSGSTSELINQFKKVAATAKIMGKTVEDAFAAGLQDALDEAGVSMEDFLKSLEKANAPIISLKQELLKLKEAIALAKANGTDFGEAFEIMTERAGQLQNAIAGASKEIKNVGSDTRNIDNVVGSISALAGGFAAVQGAIAIFGDENKDLQKTLVKVNAALALSSGIQQVANALTKEGSLVKLADSIATTGQTAALKLYTFVTGGATIATKLLRAALIATGIGAIVFLLFQAATAMGLFSGASKDAKTATDELNDSLKKQKERLDDLNDAIDADNKLQLEKLKQGNATKQQLFDKELEGKKKQLAELDRDQSNFYQRQADNRDKANKIEEQLEKLHFGSLRRSRLIDQKKELSENLKTIQEEAVAARKEREKVNTEIKQFSAEFNTQQAEDKRKADEEAAKKAKELREKAEAEAKAERARQLADELAALERRLLAVQKNSQAEVDIQKLIVAQKAKIDLNAEKLKANQIALIKERSLADQLALQEEFNKRATTTELQAQIDTTNALLAGIGLTNETRFQLQIENINATSQLEINAAEGNSAKILLIEAKRIADIRTLKLAAIDAERAEQISSTQKTNDIVKTALEKVSQDRKNDIDVRIAAIKGIESQELLSNQKLIDDLRRKYDEQLISLADYQAKAAILNQNAADIEQKSIDDQDKAREDSKEKRIEDLKEIAEVTIEVAGQVADFFSNLSSLATAQDQQRIDLQKRQLVSLVEAGAITEKEAKIRAQQIEILERQAKNRQAVREKQIAVFNALLAIPQAYLAGLKSGPQGLVLGPIFALIAAAQAAIVIARPVPKFFRGKKGNYEGPGSIAEIGSEIVERGGRMVLYTKPTQTFLGAKDKVYTHAETRQIMHNTNINTTLPAVKQEKIDYEKFAKAIPKQSIAINIEKDFISEAVNEGLSKNNYFNNRYGFK